MKFKLALVLCCICLLGNTAYAGYFEDNYLDSVILVDENHGNGNGNIEGRNITTYEDVDDLTLTPLSGLGVEFIDYSDIPSGPTLESKAQKILELFENQDFTVVSKKIENINEYTDKYLYIEEQLSDEEKQEDSREPLTLGSKGNGSKFPYRMTEEDTSRPGKISYNLGLSLNGDKYWWHEGVPSISPDSSSCKLGICKCSKRGISHLYEIDAYKDFRKTLLAAMNKGEDVEAADSKSKIVINFQDRTPPLIKYDGVNSESISENGLPRISDKYSASSGDIYMLQGVRSVDNSGCICGSDSGIERHRIFPDKYLERLNMIDALYKAEANIPGLGEKAGNAISKEELNKVEPITSRAYGHEVMRYWYQTWDQALNLNPSEPAITENLPKECYRYLDWKPLSTHWNDIASNSAFPCKVKLYKDFPHVIASDTGLPTEEYDFSVLYTPEGVGGESAVRKGYVDIVDNDLPNLIIRMQCSTRGEEVIYFPPVIDNIEFENSIVYYNPDKTAFLTNRREYLFFISGINEDTQRYFDYRYINKFPSDENIYYKIINASPREQLVVDTIESHDADVRSFKKLSKEADPKKLQKIVRVENFGYSDKESPFFYDLDYETLGVRCGTGATMTALVNLSEKDYVYVRQNTNYIIDIFADDNIKWLDKDEDGKKLSEIIPLHTGIKSGKIKVTIPEEGGKYREIELKEEDYDTEKAVNGGLNVVFDRPTPFIAASNEEALKQNFPCIEATVTDFSGLTRTIKLYVRVISESGSARIIEDLKVKDNIEVTPYHNDEELKPIENIK